MAISLVSPPPEVPPTLLHIWQECMLESCWHYNQVVGNDAPLNEPCPVYVQPDRDMIARALYKAYSMIRRQLNFDPIPVFHSQRIPLGRGTPFELQALRTEYKYVQKIGKRTAELIEGGVTVVYSASPGATVDDTATITVTTTAALDEIQVFFRTADGATAAADPRWQVVPLTVTKSGNTATITGHRSLFVQPSIWKTPFIGINQLTRNEAVTTDAADFVTLVDVYRVYADADNAVTLISDPALYKTTGLNADLVQAGQAWLQDGEVGVLDVRLKDDVCLRYYPQYVEVHYLAGVPYQYDQMDTELAQAIVHLANTLMPQKPCEICNQANASWSEDVNVVVQRASGSGYTAVERTPFGNQIGGLRAWTTVLDRRMILGGKLT